MKNIFLSTINYCDKEYCIIPRCSTDACYCVSENAILLIYTENTYSIYHNNSFNTIVVTGREIFTNKMISQKKPIDELSDADKQFICDALKLSGRLDDEIRKDSLINQKINRLKEVIMTELMEQKLQNNILSRHISSLTGKDYIVKNGGIVREGLDSSIFTICMDVYSTFKEETNMGIFDSFFGQPTGTNKFLSYIQQMPDNELIQSIKDEYLKIKGNSGKAPRMGEYGSFEFAGAMLLWKYLKEKYRRTGNNSFAEVLVLLSDTIGCAFFCMPAGEWSDKIDNDINSASDILSYDEWSDVYNYLKENYSDEIHAMEFHRGNCTDYQAAAMYRNFISAYNNAADYDSVINYYTKQGLHIKEQMSF